MIYFVLIVLLILIVISLFRGYKLLEIFKMAVPGIKTSFIVIGVLILIGCLTGLWRSSGTIAYFIVYGIRLFPPALFVLLAFILSALMSLAIGTSFGLVATAGVILMSIARAGDTNLIIVAGAIMSGIYVGDRNSPAASSASLVATLTGTDLNQNIKKMFKTSIVPIAICLFLYLVLSIAFPMQSTNSEAISLLEMNFNMNILCLLPAVLMIVLPLFKVNVKATMIINILVSILLSIMLQGNGFWLTFKSMVLGYSADSESLAFLLNGGGIKSMFSVCIILLVSGSFAGILQETGLLDNVYVRIDSLNKKIGRYPSMILLSIISCMLFCNQTIGAILVNQLSSKLYLEEEKYEKMIDMEDSVILIAGLVPWCIASSVPLATLDVGCLTLLFSFYLWLLPICRLMSKTKNRLDNFNA